MEVTHTPGHGGGPREDAVLLARLEAGADPPGEYTHRSEDTGAQGRPRPGSASLIPPNLTKVGPHPIASHQHERRRVGGPPDEHDLLRVLRPHESGHPGPRRFVGVGGLLAQGIDPPVDVGIEAATDTLFIR